MKKENGQPKIEIMKHRPIVYRYYDYLKKNHYGKDNGISRNKLKEIFGISLDTQKSILAEINNSDIFDKLISTSGSIYMCRNKQETMTAAYNEINSGLTRLLKGKKMLDKINKNGQGKIKLSDKYKEVVEVFEA